MKVFNKKLEKETFKKTHNNIIFSYSVDIEATQTVNDDEVIYETNRKVLVGTSSSDNSFASFTIKQRIANGEDMVSVKDLVSSITPEQVALAKNDALKACGLHNAIAQFNEDLSITHFVDMRYKTYSENKAYLCFNVESYNKDDKGAEYNAYGALTVHQDGSNSLGGKSWDDNVDDSQTFRPDLEYFVKDNDFGYEKGGDYKKERSLVAWVAEVPAVAIKLIKDTKYREEAFKACEQLELILKAWR